MAESSTRTVDRALQLLSHVCSSGNLALSEAAHKVDLSPSTALRLLRTMESRGFLRRDESGNYRPGLEVIRVGVQALSNESLVTMVASSLRRLAIETGESAYLAVPHSNGTDKASCIYLAMEEGTHSVRHTSWIGRTFPMRGSAGGAALSGHAPDGEAIVVEQGVEADVTAIAAPIRAPSSDTQLPRIVGALSVVSPSYRMTDDRIRAVSQQLVEEADTVLEHG